MKRLTFEIEGFMWFSLKSPKNNSSKKTKKKNILQLNESEVGAYSV